MYRVIERLPIQSIFTTNIDNLLYAIYKDGTTSYLNDLDVRGAKFSDRNAVNLITFHGCVLDDFRELVFDATDMASAYVNDPDRWHYLTSALNSPPTLFCGYSVADSGTLTSLARSASGARELSDKWITVLPGTDQGTLDYFKARGFQIIECDIRDLLDYLKTNYRPAQAGKPVTSTRELFPEWAIPDVGAVPVRPIFDFFRGSPPNMVRRLLLPIVYYQPSRTGSGCLKLTTSYPYHRDTRQWQNDTHDANSQRFPLFRSQVALRLPHP